MAEVLHLPPTPAGEELRRVIAGRRLRLRRAKLLGLAGIAAVSAAITAVWQAPALLVWNASASAPVGLYRVERHARIGRGDMVVAWAPRAARSLAASRHYLPLSVPLVKRVAAVAGNRACALGGTIRIDGRRAATRLKRDSRGRALPWWSGCRTLRTGEVFLAGDAPQSFDGRYFGITQESDLIGRAVLIWAKPAQGAHRG